MSGQLLLAGCTTSFVARFDKTTTVVEFVGWSVFTAATTSVVGVRATQMRSSY